MDLSDEGFDATAQRRYTERGTVLLDVRERDAVAREKVVHYAELHGFEVVGRSAKQDNFGLYHQYQLEDTEA